MHGGVTSLDNGILLCGRHHQVVHDDGWEVVLAADGVPEFIARRGSTPNDDDNATIATANNGCVVDSGATDARQSR